MPNNLSRHDLRALAQSRYRESGCTIGRSGSLSVISDVSGQTTNGDGVLIEFVGLNDDGGTRFAEIGMRGKNNIAAFYRHSLQS